MSKPLTERLRDAASLATPDRVRENLCSEAAGEIKRLREIAQGLLDALQPIVLETMDYPPSRPHSQDSYLPRHLVAAAQAAIAKAEGRA